MTTPDRDSLRQAAQQPWLRVKFIHETRKHAPLIGALRLLSRGVVSVLVAIPWGCSLTYTDSLRSEAAQTTTFALPVGKEPGAMLGTESLELAP